MRGWVLLVSTCVMMGLALGAKPSSPVLKPYESSLTEPQKKGRPGRRLPVQEDGATWTVTATNRNADQVIKFDIRMGDLVVYDPKSGEVIGKSEPLPNDRARLILNEKSPFHATFAIHQEGNAWTGRANYKDQDWTVLLRRVTR